MVRVYFILEETGQSFFEWVDPAVIPVKGDEVLVLGHSDTFEVVRRRVFREIVFRQPHSVVHLYVKKVEGA